MSNDSNTQPRKAGIRYKVQIFSRQSNLKHVSLRDQRCTGPLHAYLLEGIVCEGFIKMALHKPVWPKCRSCRMYTCFHLSECQSNVTVRGWTPDVLLLFEARGVSESQWGCELYAAIPLGLYSVSCPGLANCMARHMWVDQSIKAFTAWVPCNFLTNHFHLHSHDSTFQL